MPEWLIFVLVAWFVVRFLGRGKHRKRIRERERERERLAAAKTPPAVQSAAETEEERLRRRYVSGEMSVEQYERALDALYRGNSPG
jgi:uncharacterized membrane protein